MIQLIKKKSGGVAENFLKYIYKKFKNTEEMDGFLNTHHVPKLNHEDENYY